MLTALGDYKGFTIRTFKTANGLWRAIITKADGGKIKAAGPNESFDMIPVIFRRSIARACRCIQHSGARRRQIFKRESFGRFTNQNCRALSVSRTARLPAGPAFE